MSVLYQHIDRPQARIRQPAASGRFTALRWSIVSCAGFWAVALGCAIKALAG